MGEFRLKCPKNYPLNCKLLDSEKVGLERTEKFKAFLMYQFEGQDSYTVETIKSYFHAPAYYVYDAEKEAGLGVKICKICRLALASDFGIAVLTPLNYNVFLEVGLLMGLEKKSVYIVSKKILKRQGKTIKDMPFDLSDQLVIKYSKQKELTQELEKEIPQFIEPVKIITGYDREFREYMEDKLKVLHQEGKRAVDLLKLFVLEQSKQGVTERWMKHRVTLYQGEIFFDDLLLLERLGLISSTLGRKTASSSETFCKLEESYRAFLQDYFWKS